MTTTALLFRRTTINSQENYKSNDSNKNNYKWVPEATLNVVDKFLYPPNTRTPTKYIVDVVPPVYLSRHNTTPQRCFVRVPCSLYRVFVALIFGNLSRVASALHIVCIMYINISIILLFRDITALINCVCW